MIYVTQGHEHSIGLEVFLKSFLLLSRSEKEEFILFCQKESLDQTLKTLSLPYQFHEDHIQISQSILKCQFLDSSSSLPQSTLALEKAIELIGQESATPLLLTLPTSKDQILWQNQVQGGHTEYFRKKFEKPYLPMVFYSYGHSVLLLSDHIPLKNVSSYLTQDLIFEKSKAAIEGIEHYFGPLEEIYFAGINPHAGEKGLLGQEDKEIEKGIKKLRSSFPGMTFQGPLSGDTLHFPKNEKKKQLFIYSYHDQGLTLFKGLYGFCGINITLGLPFLRMSVDHGTAFELYQKNSANYLGCFYTLQMGLSLTKNQPLKKNYEHKRNNHHQGQGS